MVRTFIKKVYVAIASGDKEAAQKAFKGRGICPVALHLSMDLCKQASCTSTLLLRCEWRRILPVNATRIQTLTRKNVN